MDGHLRFLHYYTYFWASTYTWIMPTWFKKMMAESEKTLTAGESVFIYPEGTRSSDGEIKAFKPGAFLLAQKTRVPILPIVLNGTGDVLPKRKMKTDGLHRIRIRVRVLDEIPCARFADLSVDETIDFIRGIMIDELAKLKKEMSLSRSL